MPIPDYIDLDEAISAVQNKMVCGMNESWLNALSRWLPELKQLREANIRLEKEADWLAERVRVKDCIMDDTVENCTEKGFPCVACFRSAARRAVEESRE